MATAALALLGASAPAAAQTVRSSLYPTTWKPVNEGGPKDGSGRFLQDFSYAGYRSGDAPIPTGFNNNRVRNAVLDFGANNTYSSTTNPLSPDATTAIQNAIDDTCSAGGGTILLPAGAYRIKPQGTNAAALHLKCNNIILRGDVDAQGQPSTYLFVDQANMRAKRVILAGAIDDRFAWYTEEVSTPTLITSASTDPTRTITVANASAFAVNAPIVIRTATDSAWKSRHGMGPGQNGCDATLGCWWSGDAQGLLYYRTVKGISGNQILLDAPVRYILDPNSSTGNDPVAYRTAPANYNIGIENLRIGMRENTKGLMSNDYLNTPNTAAYETANAQVIRFVGVKDSWARNVQSYKPGANSGNTHIASIGIALTSSSRNISVLNSYMGYPQNRLAGGNGYLYILAGQDSLVRDSVAEEGRHNFQFTNMASSGNVILNGETINSFYKNDFHVALSHANLVDGVETIGMGWEVINRAALSDGAGITGTQNVFWNVRKGSTAGGTLVESDQFGYGYVIGTRGSTAVVDTGVNYSVLSPADFSEHINNGANLQPQSLYLDQKAKRDADASY